MMKIQYPSHRPERHIMQDPSEEEPPASVHYFTSPVEHDGVVDATPLLAHGSVDVKNYKYYKEDYVSPPNDGIPEQIYSLIVPREELPL
jgi:hypothetical protein